MQTDNPVENFDHHADPKPVQELMGHATLGAIVKKAKILDQLSRCLVDILPEEYSGYCHILNLNETQLKLAADNSAVATRIRYQEDALLKAFDRIADLPQIDRIECVVRPRSPGIASQSRG